MPDPQGRRMRGARYNFPTMLRWFIAVFTLHFLLSVGVSAFGKASALEPLLQGPHAAASCILEDALPTLDVSVSSGTDDPQALAETAHEHALADDQQDLPDDLSLRVRPAHSRVALYPPLRPDDARPPSPAPDVPHKPPRTARLVA